MNCRCVRMLSGLVVLGAVAGQVVARGAEPASSDPARSSSAQWGGSASRNNVSDVRGLPVQWDVGKRDAKTGRWNGASKQIRWVARLGNQCYTTPIVLDDKVFCGTNNAGGYVARYPASVDLGCLLCFDRPTGGFLWQYSSEKLKSGKNVDWPEVGLCSCPLVEKDRLWTVTNRGEVICLDTTGPAGKDPAVIWTFDMMGKLGVIQRYMSNCSVTAAGDLLFVGTSNGRDVNEKLPAPRAPSFLALDKKTGALVWADSSPGENILDGQWASPTFAELGGVPQAIFAGGDGWLYSFEAVATADHKAKLLWRFDCNPKQSVWDGASGGERNIIVSTPVIDKGRVFVATGRDPEAGEGQADLWCIDPTKRGDISAELVVDADGKSVPPRRLQAVRADAGEKVVPNPNAAVVWHYRGSKAPGAERVAGFQEGSASGGGVNAEFQGVFHRTLGSPAIKDDVLVIGDFAGLVHCLDAKTGRVYWTCDLQSAVWGSPLVADGHVYLGDEDGDVIVFQFGTALKVLAKNNVGGPVHSTPVAAAGTLYLSTATHLFAIGAAGE